MNKSLIRSLAISALVLSSLSWSAAASAHATPQREVPAAGTTMHGSPPMVRVWFDDKLEPAFSKLEVKNSHGNTVSDKSRVDAETQRMLFAPLPMQPPGEYHVYWKAVALDGHTSKGDFTFTIQP